MRNTRTPGSPSALHGAAAIAVESDGGYRMSRIAAVSSDLPASPAAGLVRHRRKIVLRGQQHPVGQNLRKWLRSTTASGSNKPRCYAASSTMLLPAARLARRRCTGPPWLRRAWRTWSPWLGLWPHRISVAARRDVRVLDELSLQPDRAHASSGGQSSRPAERPTRFGAPAYILGVPSAVVEQSMLPARARQFMPPYPTSRGTTRPATFPSRMGSTSSSRLARESPWSPADHADRESPANAGTACRKTAKPLRHPT
jgi:hypothetical protein